MPTFSLGCVRRVNTPAMIIISGGLFPYGGPAFYRHFLSDATKHSSPTIYFDRDLVHTKT